MKNTLNPYRASLGLLYRRLAWDVDPRSWSARRQLKILKNSHKGKKCVILCNGPSLLDVDFGSLNDTFCIGLNKINLLYDKTEFRCDAIVAVNKFVIEQNADFYSSTGCQLFIDAMSARKQKLLRQQNVIPIHTGIDGFARDCSLSVSQGYTVTYVAMQLAFHLGFQSVALVGCDHNFCTTGNPNSVDRLEDDDPNHFDRTYFKDQLWQHPDLNGSERSYLHALHAFNEAGRVLCNASSNSQLKILPRISLNDFLKS